jgi:uncharacterized membrane protein YagU involved in acid resistance
MAQHCASYAYDQDGIVAVGLDVARIGRMDRRLELALCGVVGGVAGLLAKRLAYAAWNRLVKPRTTDHRPKRSWSVVGQHHLPGEPSNVALARVLYTKFAGRPPSERTKHLLGTAADWGVGAALGVLYAILRDRRDDLDLRGGLTLGIVVWALLDEIGMSLVGLQDAPTSYPPWTHVRALAEHVAFGAAVAATTQKLARATCI